MSFFVFHFAPTTSTGSAHRNHRKETLFCLKAWQKNKCPHKRFTEDRGELGSISNHSVYWCYIKKCVNTCLTIPILSLTHKTAQCFLHVRLWIIQYPNAQPIHSPKQILGYSVWRTCGEGIKKERGEKKNGLTLWHTTFIGLSDLNIYGDHHRRRKGTSKGPPAWVQRGCRPPPPHWTTRIPLPQQ